MGVVLQERLDVRLIKKNRRIEEMQDSEQKQNSIPKWLEEVALKEISNLCSLQPILVSQSECFNVLPDLCEISSF